VHINLYYFTQYALPQRSVYISIYLYIYEKINLFEYIYLISRIDDAVNNKRKQQRKRSNGEDAKKPIKKRRTIASPKCLANDHEPVEKSYNNVNDRDRDQYKRNEDSYRTVTERRKSLSKGEDGSRMEKEKAGTSIGDDRDRIERRRNDDDEKSEEANVEHDTNDTIAQIDP